MSDLAQMSYEDLQPHFAAAFDRHALQAGCEHQLVRFPLFQFHFDYLCLSCHGYHERVFTPAIAAMSLADLDKLVGAEVHGSVVAEFVLAQQGAPA